MGLIDSAELIHPLVEPEIALVVSRDVDDEVVGRASVHWRSSMR